MAVVFLDTAFTSGNDQGKRETMCLLILSYESQNLFQEAVGPASKQDWTQLDEESTPNAITGKRMHDHKATRDTLDVGWDQLPRRPFYTQSWLSGEKGCGGWMLGRKALCLYYVVPSKLGALRLESQPEGLLSVSLSPAEWKQ